jgi:hypothetical protein
MKRPVPEGHITSPPQSVSMPSTASAISTFLLDPSSFSFFTERTSHHRMQRPRTAARKRLRDQIVQVERGLIQIFAIPGEEAQAAPRTPPSAPPAISPEAMITPRSRICALLAAGFSERLPRKCERNPPTSAGVFSSSGRYMPSAKTMEGTCPASPWITAMNRADAEQNIGHRLAAHEAHHQRLHDGSLRRRQHHARVARRGFAELKGARQQDDGQAHRGDGAAITPRNFTFSCAAGVEPSQ